MSDCRLRGGGFFGAPARRFFGFCFHIKNAHSMSEMTVGELIKKMNDLASEQFDDPFHFTVGGGRKTLKSCNGCVSRLTVGCARRALTPAEQENQNYLYKRSKEKTPLLLGEKSPAFAASQIAGSARCTFKFVILESNDKSRIKIVSAPGKFYNI